MARVNAYEPGFRERHIDPLLERLNPLLIMIRLLFWFVVLGLFTFLWVGPVLMFGLLLVMIINGILSLIFLVFFLLVWAAWLAIRPFSRNGARAWLDRWEPGRRFTQLADFCVDRILDDYAFPAADRLISVQFDWLRDKRRELI